MYATPALPRLSPLAARRALRYPYDCPYTPVVVTGGSFLRPQVEAWPARDGWAALLEGRSPTLAIGSNRSARQLARKYADWPSPIRMPVWPVGVAGIDVHFAASIGHYGAIPATPYRAPGTVCAMMLVWLTEAEFVRMDATEGLGVAYDRFDVPVTATGDVPGRFDSVVLYRHRAGTLAFNGGRSVGMQELPVRDGSVPRLSQRQMQRRLRDQLAPGLPLSAFIAGNIADEALRDERIERLALRAIAPWQPDAEFRPSRHDGEGTVPAQSPPVRLHSLAEPAIRRLTGH